MMKLCYFVLFVNIVITIFMNQEVIMVLGICQSVFLYGQIFMCQTLMSPGQPTRIYLNVMKMKVLWSCLTSTLATDLLRDNSTGLWCAIIRLGTAVRL